MSATDEKGSAAVELTIVVIFLSFFVVASAYFASISITSHSASLRLEERVFKMMLDKNSPACLSSWFKKEYVETKKARNIYKRLYFAPPTICEGEFNED